MFKNCLLALGRRFSSELPEYLKKHDIELTVNPLGRMYTEDELMKELEDMDAVIAAGEPYTGRVMNSAQRLKIIARSGVGYDNVDISAATERGIYVTWTPIPELAKAVADEAWALILCVLKKISFLDRHVRAGGYDLQLGDQVRDAYSLTLGIIGLGRIGVEVARRARGFEMKILYYDLIRRRDLEKEWALEYVSLEDLLKRSDIITIHSPLTPQTRGLIGEKEISMMKKDAILVNTARGAVVQEEPLYKALKEGRIRGAGLSVLSKEPPTSKNPFYKLGEELPNVVITPHIGAGQATRRMMMLTAANDVIAVLEGRTPRYLLNPEVESKSRALGR